MVISGSAYKTRAIYKIAKLKKVYSNLHVRLRCMSDHAGARNLITTTTAQSTPTSHPSVTAAIINKSQLAMAADKLVAAKCTPLEASRSICVSLASTKAEKDIVNSIKSKSGDSLLYKHPSSLPACRNWSVAETIVLQENCVHGSVIDYNFTSQTKLGQQ